MKISNNQLKYIRSLKMKKFRDKYGVFTVEGHKIAQELLQEKQLEIEKIYATENWVSNQASLLKNFQSKLQIVADSELKKISNLSTPNQVFLIIKKQTHSINPDILRQSFSLYLDNIQDPGNLGTILRTADWFGIPYVFFSKGTVEWSNPKVLQSTMGAFLRVQAIEMAFENIVEQFPDIPTFAAILEGENLYNLKTKGNSGIIIIGNESKGISKSVIEKANYGISIPRGINGGAESLNAGVATGIICSHLIN